MNVTLLPGLDPYEHLATEECLLAQLSGDSSLLLYRNRPAVVAGSFQNTHTETRAALLAQRNILLARRISGGGCVYHDGGNLCWAYLLPCDKPELLRLGDHLEPLLRGLARLGVAAERGGRNEILLQGRKIGGSAARILRERLLFHGTLLYDADLDAMDEALTPEPGVVKTVAAQSVRSPVVNIKSALNLQIGTEEFLLELARILGNGAQPAALPPDILAQARALAREKYETWDWIYGRNPDYTVLWQRPGKSLQVEFHRERVKRALLIQGAQERELPHLIGLPYGQAQRSAFRQNDETILARSQEIK